MFVAWIKLPTKAENGDHGIMKILLEVFEWTLIEDFLAC